jgi:hypothetical protein
MFVVGFTSGVRIPITHWAGGWVGPRADLNAVVKRKTFLAPAGNPIPNPGCPPYSLIIILTELPLHE